jgi:tRNA G10  N-methylase Trm11
MGIDISEKAVTDTKTNLRWLFDHTKDLNRLQFSININQKDTRTLSAYFPRGIISEIVTEPYLGPTLHRSADDVFVDHAFQELAPLYRDAVSSFSHVLKPGGMVVMIYPAFNVKGAMRFLDLITPLKSMGFSQVPLSLSGGNENLFPEITDRKTIIYGNREDFVLREIVRFQKNV